MGNIWQQVLTAIEPEYTTLKSVLEMGPLILAELGRRDYSWTITLKEKSRLPEVNPVWSDFGKLDERVNWTIEQLKEWPGVRRMAHDIWYFKRKRDAEKFQTLYNLAWGSE
jgi:hypothetical protein